jgi:hypothetical protein
MRKTTKRLIAGNVVDCVNEEHFCERCGEANAAFMDRRGWWCGWNGTDAICKRDPVATAPKIL